MSDEYGTGFSVANIRNCRQLYLTFPKGSYGYSLIGKIHWSHLRTIMRLDNEEERDFYLNEVANGCWSVKELERNIKSGYFKRILSTQFPEKMGQTPKRHADDNPTIGIIFCTDKDETMVKYSVLNESEQIFASKYMTVLPTIEELRNELERDQLMYGEGLKED